MSPSKESQLLSDLSRQINKAFPADGDPVASRFIYENVQQVAKEPTGVAFKEDIGANRPCLWIRPVGASEKHVILFMHGGGKLEFYSSGMSVLTPSFPYQALRSARHNPIER